MFDVEDIQNPGRAIYASSLLKTDSKMKNEVFKHIKSSWKRGVRELLVTDWPQGDIADWGRQFLWYKNQTLSTSEVKTELFLWLITFEWT